MQDPNLMRHHRSDPHKSGRGSGSNDHPAGLLVIVLAAIVIAVFAVMVFSAGGGSGNAPVGTPATMPGTPPAPGKPGTALTPTPPPAATQPGAATPAPGN